MFFVIIAPVNAVSVAWDKDNDEWLQQTSAHFSIVYLKQHQREADRVLGIAEKVHRDLVPFFKEFPDKRTEIILIDDYDKYKPQDLTLEYGEIRLMMAPPTQFSQFESEYGWVEIFLSYEYSTILHINLSSGSLRNKLISIEFTPLMLVTGLALYLENTQKYEKTRQYPFHSKMRMEVASNLLNDLQQVVLNNRKWPLMSNSLYGAYFIEYLTKTFGEDKLLAFLSDYSTNLTSYVFLNAETEDVFGKAFLTLWSDYKAYLNKKFEAEISELTKNKVDGEEIASSPFLLKSATGKNGIYLHTETGQDRHEIKQFKNGDWKHIAYVDQLIDMDSHPEYGLIITRNIDYADLHSMNDIFLYSDGKWQRITTRKRFKHVRWSQHGKKIYATRHVQGKSQLWELDIENNTSIKLFNFPNNYIIGEFDVAPNGNKIIASVKTPQKNWRLLEFDIKKRHWTPVTFQNGIESSPEFMADGSLLYSASYDGTFNIYHLNSQKTYTEKITNTLAGAFKPKWQPDSGLIFQSYGATSYYVRQIPIMKPLSKINISATNKQNEIIDITEIQYQSDLSASEIEDIYINQPEPYSTLRTIKPHAWIPWLYADEVRTLVGIDTYGADALGRHSYEVYALWDVQNKLPSIFAQYKFDNRWEVNFINDYKFKNLILTGDLTHYQISNSKTYSLQRNNILNYNEDKLRLHAAVTYAKDQLERLPDIPAHIPPQAIELLSLPREELTIGAAITFDNREYYLDVDGVGWGHYVDFIFEKNIWETDYEGQKYQTQWRGTWDLPGRTTLLTRIAAGYSTSGAKRFSIGGNSLQEEIRLFNRSAQAIRGYDDLSQFGHYYSTQRLELSTWFTDLSHNFGLFPAGVGNVSGKLFADSGSAWDSNRSYKQLTGIGGEVTLGVILGYNYNIPISLGYAYGLDDVKGRSYLYLNFSSLY